MNQLIEVDLGHQLLRKEVPTTSKFLGEELIIGTHENYLAIGFYAEGNLNRILFVYLGYWLGLYNAAVLSKVSDEFSEALVYLGDDDV